MTTRRAAAGGGLSTSDIDGIRGSLAAGRKPKVMFTASAGQIAGEIGQVVKLDDPDQSDEWLVVRFGRDELPFSPADLTMPPRGRTAKRAEPKPAEPKQAEPKPAPPPVPAPRPAAKAATPAASAAAPAAAGSGTAGSGTAGSGTAGPATAQSRPAKRTSRKARSTRPKAPPSLTVTLAYETGEWTVAAHQGSKTLAKPYLVRPADALKMVAMLDVPGVHDAVEAIVTAELTEAAQRAEQLRSELAEVEARLADLRDAG